MVRALDKGLWEHLVAETEQSSVIIKRFVDVPGRGLLRMAESEVPDPPPLVPEGVQDVYAALRRGDLEESAARMEGLELEGRDAHHLTGCRVFWLMLSGDLTEAHEFVGALDDEARSHDAVVAAHASILLVSGASAQAVKMLDGVLERHPRHELARYLSALHKAQNGDLQGAHDLLVGLCRDYPDHALARLQLGQVLMAAGDVARAGTLFEAAIDDSPRLAQAWERFAALLVLGGQPLEAMAVAKRGLAWHPSSRPLLEVLARSALSVGSVDIALDATRLVLATAGDDPVAFANHVVALTSSGQRDRAKELVLEARGLFPDDAGLSQLATEIDAA
ncbi:MAG: tetratricopeptide repeat protein [Pseudomonadota bacterium]